MLSHHKELESSTTITFKTSHLFFSYWYDTTILFMKLWKFRLCFCSLLTWLTSVSIPHVTIPADLFIVSQFNNVSRDHPYAWRAGGGRGLNQKHTPSTQRGMGEGGCLKAYVPFTKQNMCFGKKYSSKTPACTFFSIYSVTHHRRS